MKIGVLCIGDELLKGAVINTNLAYMGQRLLEIGVISRDEFDLMFTYLGSLAKTGKPPPEVTPKLIRGPEAAEMLAISYAEFRKLEAEGVFPFKRRAFGKNVRYFYPDIVEFMRSGGIENAPKKEENK